ncbi:hypothetical protein [Enterobacter roggenkampii]|uniref:hypothetical protein n=1 Tax=Enterobacter roggenkampii TaxID=1812935 RepID=UPI001FD800F0|nr:hypothetical protein [Enterobacter roggenkampii]
MTAKSSAVWRNRLQRERDERLKQEAAEQAPPRCRREAQSGGLKPQRREAEEKARAELAERQRIEAEQRAAREAGSGRVLAAKRRNRDRERRRRRGRSRPSGRKSSAKPTNRQSAKADVMHRKMVGTNIVNALTSNTSFQPANRLSKCSPL